MQLTGKSLVLVRQAIVLAISDTHNNIATCPDVIAYADEIEELTKEKSAFQQLWVAVDRAITREEAVLSKNALNTRKP